MIDVSVIIPVYNSEDYLVECLDSIINQTLKNIEILAINDGSVDNSLNILKEYQKHDNRIIIINQENKGPGAARNVGIKRATGKYIYFCDSDDYLELHALEKLFNVSVEKQTDLVMFKLKKFNHETGELLPSKYYEMKFLKELVGNNVFCYKDVKSQIFDMVVSSPACFYKRDLIEDIKFPEQIYFEDNVFFTEVILTAKRVYFLDDFLYYRRIRNNSITTINDEYYLDTIDISNLLVEVVKKLGHYEEFKSQLYIRKIDYVYYHINLVDDLDVKEKYFSKLKKDFVLHKPFYEKDDFFLNKLNKRTKYIFYRVIESNSWYEFVDSVKTFDNKNELKKLKKQNKTLKKKINKLEKDNKKLLNQINHFKSTKAYKLWIRYKRD